MTRCARTSHIGNSKELNFNEDVSELKMTPVTNKQKRHLRLRINLEFFGIMLNNLFGSLLNSINDKITHWRKPTNWTDMLLIIRH